MDFFPFDTTEMDKYAAEAKALWGKTQPYLEFEQKTASQTTAELCATGDAIMDIFAQFGAIRHLSPACADAQALVAKLQSFITEHYYTCTKQILQGLGQMYIAGNSMTKNIEGVGGEGTAAFVKEAINIFADSL